MRCLILLALVAVCCADHSLTKHTRLRGVSPLFTHLYPKTEETWYPKTVPKMYQHTTQQWYPTTEEQWYPKTLKQWNPYVEYQHEEKYMRDMPYHYYKKEMPYQYYEKTMPYQHYEKQMPYEHYGTEMPIHSYEKVMPVMEYPENVPYVVYQFYKQGVHPIIHYIQHQLVEHQQVALRTLINEVGYHYVEVLFNCLVGHTFTLTPEQYLDLIHIIEKCGHQHILELLNHFAGERFVVHPEIGVEKVIEFKHYIDLYEVFEYLKHCCTEIVKGLYETDYTHNYPRMYNPYYHETVETQWPRTWTRDYPMKWWNTRGTPYMTPEYYHYPQVAMIH